MIHCPAYIAGRATETGRLLEVHYPYDGSLTGTATLVGREHLNEAIEAALDGGKKTLPRHERATILRKAARLLAGRSEEFARLITRETGLCLRESRYETGRSSDVLEFAAMEALRDDGQIFSCDISPAAKARKIFTTRYPVSLVAAITP